MRYNFKNNLAALNSALCDWSEREDNIFKKYCRYSTTPQHIKDRAYSLRDEIEKHVQVLLYDNLIKPFVAVYFQDNYFNLTTEIIKSYTGEAVMDLPFIEKLYVLTGNGSYTAIKEAYGDAVCMSEYYLEIFMLETWKEVCAEIESKTLSLFN